MKEDPRNAPVPANIADPFWDLLLPLDEARRLGFIRRLAVGFYEQWSPTRDEVAYLVDYELGRLTTEQLNGPSPSTRGPDYAGLAPAGAAHPDVDAIAVPSNGLRAVPSTATDPAEAAVPASRGTKLAAFNVDCGILAPPFRFIAAGLSNAGWTVRRGQRYRRTFLHYRLVASAAPSAGHPSPSAPIIFNADITCVPDIAVPQVATDGRSFKHSVGRGIVLGSRGPWPIADAATSMSFWITAQSAHGGGRRRLPAGSLRVDLRSGAASWLATPGFADINGGRAATR